MGDERQAIADELGFEASQCQTQDGSALLKAIEAWIEGISPHERLWQIADQYASEGSGVLAFLEREDVHVGAHWMYDGTGWGVRVSGVTEDFEGIAKNVVSAARAAILAEQKLLEAKRKESDS